VSNIRNAVPLVVTNLLDFKILAPQTNLTAASNRILFSLKLESQHKTTSTTRDESPINMTYVSYSPPFPLPRLEAEESSSFQIPSLSPNLRIGGPILDYSPISYRRSPSAPTKSNTDITNNNNNNDLPPTMMNNKQEESHSKSRIAFGSCNVQDVQNNLWPIIESRKPAAFIWGGDAIYADQHIATDWSTFPPNFSELQCATPDRLKVLYREQLAVPGYRRLLDQNITVFGTFDGTYYKESLCEQRVIL
jgi:hypothetical protein